MNAPSELPGASSGIRSDVRACIASPAYMRAVPRFSSRQSTCMGDQLREPAVAFRSVKQEELRGPVLAPGGRARAGRPDADAPGGAVAGGARAVAPAGLPVRAGPGRLVPGGRRRRPHARQLLRAPRPPRAQRRHAAARHRHRCAATPAAAATQPRCLSPSSFPACPCLPLSHAPEPPCAPLSLRSPSRPFKPFARRLASHRARR